MPNGFLLLVEVWLQSAIFKTLGPTKSTKNVYETA